MAEMIQIAFEEKRFIQPSREDLLRLSHKVREETHGFHRAINLQPLSPLTSAMSPLTL
jgi:hypothetical protein